MNPIYAERYLEVKKLDWRLTKIKEGDLVLDVGSIQYSFLNICFNNSSK